MKFVKITITEGIFSKPFEFVNGLNQIYSKNNSAGKTTLLRLLLYSIGYNIPSTRKMDFDKCVTSVECELDDGTHLFATRVMNELTVNHNNTQKLYMLPSEQLEFLSVLFNIDNKDVLENLLGTFYVDQEKGWTLLNDGVVIGRIHFDIKQLVRGLTDKDCTELLKKIASVDYQINKYQKMLSLSKYQRQINNIKGTLSDDTYVMQTNDRISALVFDKKQIEDELLQLNRIIDEQESFRKYIEKMHLIVITPSGEEIPVNQHNIKSFRDMTEIVATRKKLLLVEHKRIQKMIADLKSSIDKDRGMFDVKTMIETFDESVASMDLDNVAITNILNRLRDERKALSDKLNKMTAIDNEEFIQDFYNTVYKYLCDFGVEQFAQNSPTYLFTRDLKSMSGAVLQMTTLAYKLAYISVVRNVTNTILPIILDSPRGHELDDNNIIKIEGVLKRDFKQHQVIVASIYTDFGVDKCITLEQSFLGDDVNCPG